MVVHIRQAWRHLRGWPAVCDHREQQASRQCGHTSVKVSLDSSQKPVMILCILCSVTLRVACETDVVVLGDTTTRPFSRGQRLTVTSLTWDSRVLDEKHAWVDCGAFHGRMGIEERQASAIFVDLANTATATLGLPIPVRSSTRRSTIISMTFSANQIDDLSSASQSSAALRF